MAPHSSTLAWKIPWMEEPGGLQSMRSLRVGHDWATSLSLFTFTHWRRKWQPTPVFLPGESQGQGAWWAAVYGVAQSRTRLKQLSSVLSWGHDLGPDSWLREVKWLVQGRSARKKGLGFEHSGLVPEVVGKTVMILCFPKKQEKYLLYISFSDWKKKPNM